MIKIETLTKIAKGNTDKLKRCQNVLKLTAQAIIKMPVASFDWYWSEKDKKFICYLAPWNIKGSDMPSFQYREVTANYHGVQMTMRLNLYENRNYYYAEIEENSAMDDDVKDFYNTLVKRRADFTATLMKTIGEKAIDFFKNNENLYAINCLNYANGLNIATPNFCIYQCGASESEKAAMYDEKAKEMQKVLGDNIGYTTHEALSSLDAFCPTIFSDDSQLEKRFELNRFIDLVITRQVAYAEDSMYTPALYARLELKNSIDHESISPVYELALNLVSEHVKTIEEHQCLCFDHQFKEYDEWIIVDGKLTAYIPCYHKSYIDAIVKRMNQTYEGEFNFVACKHVFPIQGTQPTDCIIATAM